MTGKNQHKLQTLVSLVSNTAFERRATDYWRNAFESLQQEIQTLVSFVVNTTFERRLTYRNDWEGIFTTLQALCLRNEHEIEDLVSLLSRSVFEREITLGLFMLPGRWFSPIICGIFCSNL